MFEEGSVIFSSVLDLLRLSGLAKALESPERFHEGTYVITTGNFMHYSIVLQPRFPFTGGQIDNLRDEKRSVKEHGG